MANRGFTLHDASLRVCIPYIPKKAAPLTWNRFTIHQMGFLYSLSNRELYTN